ncbi:hypothetical protein F5Y08DRAFT_318287 [Xylaria arbuscula]|nr:hypothetical protein F5Y08DRAFT_318287 [Xylaria arbuscula]
MAGHNFSRYLSTLWSAVFAPFNFLFSHLWRFFYTQTIEATDIASLSPSPPSPPSKHSLPPPLPPLPPTSPASTSGAPTSVTSDAATFTAEPTGPTGPAVDSSSVPSVSPFGLHDQRLSHLIVDTDLPDHTIPNGADNEHCDTDPDFTATSSPREYQQHEPANMARRRGGRGRGGAKSSLQNTTTGTSVASATLTADTAKNQTASPTQSYTDALGDTSLAQNHLEGSGLSLSERRDNGIRSPSSKVSQKLPINGKKENLAPSKDNDVSCAVRSDTQALPLRPVTNNAKESRKTDTRIDTDFDSTDTAPTVTTVHDDSSSSSSVADQLHAVADRLTLDDAPSAEHKAERTLNDATSAAEASALPVPLVVAVPILPQLQTAQSESQTPPPPSLPGLIEPTTEEGRAEREYHLRFMREALDMGDLALKTNETPVGCVLVYKGRVIARGMNATNITRNGTRHAEFMALSALLSRRQSSDIKVTNINIDLDEATWGDVDPKDGHIYPYGQKLHPAPVVDRSIISECVLYVTVEPCVMCASLLRQLGIKKVYFGAVNDKFGGTGGVFRVHMNSKPVPIPKDRPYQLGYGPQDLSLISKGKAVALPRDDDEGDGGNVEPGYPVEGGYLRDDAVSLLRRFYVQENGRAPQPRKKEGRAARLYAAMETQSKPINTSDLSDNGPETPVEVEAPISLGGKPEETTIGVVCV